MLTQEELKKLVRYDPETGKMFWLPRPREMFKSERDMNAWNARFSYKLAGSKHKIPRSNTSYIIIKVFGKIYKAHRLAWLYVYGEYPKDQIDHINGDGTDNRICNLRDVDQTENQRNRAISKNNTSGFVGVYWHKAKNNWKAGITVNGKDIHLGSFTNKQDAIKARQDAEIKYGFHENHGRISND